MDKIPFSKNLPLYLGLVFLLSGTLAARGQDVILLLGGIALLVLEVVEFRGLPPQRATIAQLILSSTLLLLSVINALESVGKQFTAHQFYLMMMLIGAFLILIETVKRYASLEMGGFYSTPVKVSKTGS